MGAREKRNRKKVGKVLVGPPSYSTERREGYYNNLMRGLEEEGWGRILHSDDNGS